MLLRQNATMHAIRLFSFLLILLTIPACEKGDPLNGDIFTVTRSSSHFVYHAQADDTIPIDTTWQEAYYTWLTEQLQLHPEKKIHFYKYISRTQLADLTGRNLNAFADSKNWRIHTIWPVDNHEIVHLLVNQFWGLPPALFDEGMAVAHQATPWKETFVPGWNGADFDSLAGEILARQHMPEYIQLLDSHQYWEFGSDICYPVAGSFMDYCLDRFGLDKISVFIGKVSYWDKPGTTEKQFEKIVGTELNSVWHDWLAYIQTRFWFGYAGDTVPGRFLSDHICHIPGWNIDWRVDK